MAETHILSACPEIRLGTIAVCCELLAMDIRECRSRLRLADCTAPVRLCARPSCWHTARLPKPRPRRTPRTRPATRGARSRNSSWGCQHGAWAGWTRRWATTAAPWRARTRGPAQQRRALGWAASACCARGSREAAACPLPRSKAVHLKFGSVVLDSRAGLETPIVRHI